MRYRYAALGIAGLLIGLVASFAGAQQATKRVAQEAFLLGGWAADEALRFDPFRLVTRAARKDPSSTAVVPSAAPVPVSATVPSPTPTVSEAASPTESVTASDTDPPGGSTSLRPPIRIPYRPPLRSPFKPPWP
jgi:hypothetical protein